jgi:hypothetical protein
MQRLDIRVPICRSRRSIGSSTPPRPSPAWTLDQLGHPRTARRASGVGTRGWRVTLRRSAIAPISGRTGPGRLGLGRPGQTELDQRRDPPAGSAARPSPGRRRPSNTTAPSRSMACPVAGSVAPRVPSTSRSASLRNSAGIGAGQPDLAVRTWQTCYGRLRCWQGDGTWPRVWALLAAARWAARTQWRELDSAAAVSSRPSPSASPRERGVGVTELAAPVTG